MQLSAYMLVFKDKVFHANFVLAVPTNCREGQIRLVGGVRAGTVQICLSGLWGTVCDNSWDSRDAGVVCRQVGYPVLGKTFETLITHTMNIIACYTRRVMFSYLLQHATGAIPFENAYFGRGTGAVLLDYVSCTGNEQFLANCTNNGVGITSSFCSHYHDAGVHCPGNI